MKKIRVMIVEDSPVVLEFLKFLIDSDPRLQVAAAVGSAEDALDILQRVAPDVISMDIRLPGMNGFEATQRIMSERPTPIVVVSASVEAEDMRISMNALRAGALSVVEKPVGMAHRDYQAMANRLCTQLVLMSQVKVIRQRFPRGLPISTSAAPVSAARQPPHVAATGPYQMLGMVASTGGPAALQTVLAALGPQFPLPILLVQHISAGFLEGFASWLGSVCGLRVVIAKSGEFPERGKVYLPPADRHLCLERGRLKHDAGEPISLQRPSGTALLRSMARELGPAALGVLLTGMGDDGATGMKSIYDGGGYTIAEDESTAVVYGMPRVAVQLGGVSEILPLPEISRRLLELASLGREAV